MVAEGLADAERLAVGIELRRLPDDVGSDADRPLQVCGGGGVDHQRLPQFELWQRAEPRMADDDVRREFSLRRCREHQRSRSPITHVRRVKTPTLLVHGDLDLTPPAGQAEELLIRRCVITGYPRNWCITRASAVRTFQERAHQIDLYQRIVGWVASICSREGGEMSDNLAEIYRLRRQKLVEKTGGGVILVGSPGVAPDKNLLDKNLLYLTGIDDRNAYLLIVPNGVAVEHGETRSTPELMQGRIVHEILFVQERSERDAFMDGAAATFDAIRTATGVDRVFSLSKLNEELQRALMKNDTLWFNTGTTPELDKPLTADLLLINSSPRAVLVGDAEEPGGDNSPDALREETRTKLRRYEKRLKFRRRFTSGLCGR